MNENYINAPKGNKSSERNVRLCKPIFDWEENDVMAIPNFLWRRHVNNGTEDAIIYTTSDKALLENIGQYRSQGKAKDGSIVQIVQ